MSGRPYDLVLWGATGHTGRLTADYLARRHESGLRWALAGRNRARLEAVRQRLTGHCPDLAELPILLADGTDADAMDAIARQTRVVCAQAGPFARHGSAIVAACVRHRTHYCDITGEPAWIRQMVDAHHRVAAAAGVRIVHCCGIDSVPSDLGCLVLHDQLRQHHQRDLAEVTCLVTVWQDRYSGGTYASMLDFWEVAAKDKTVRASIMDPYGLNDEGRRAGPDPKDGMGVRRLAGQWTAPFMMGPVNSRVVRRSNQVMGYPYGEQFRYTEARGYGPGAGGWWRAHKAAASLTSFFLRALLAATRRGLRKGLPAPGEGPVKQHGEPDGFRFELTGTSSGAEPIRVHGVVEAALDVYEATAVFAAEAALSLAQDAARLPDRAGVLTPAAALGMPLVERLRRAGIPFEVQTPDPPGLGAREA